MAVFRTGQESGEAAPGSEIALGEAVREYIIDCRLRNLSSRTIEWYDEKLQFLMRGLKDLPLGSLGIAEVRSLTEVLMRDRSVATVNGYLRTLRAFLNWSVREGLQVGFDPRRVRCLKEPKRVPTVLSDEQMVRLLEAPDRRSLVGFRDHTVLVLMLDTGLRNGELCGLDVSDLSLPVVKVWGKGSKERLVAVSPNVEKQLLRWLRRRRAKWGAEGPLFPTISGGRMGRRRLQEIVQECGEKAKLGVHLYPHVLRFTFATHYLRNGGTVTRLQCALGHSTIHMSLHYARLADTDAFAESVEFSPIAKLSRPVR